MFAKKLVATGLAIIVTLGLAACDPPMPPEILAAQAEKVVRCVDGNFGLATPAAISDVIDSWAGSIADSCPGMTLTKLDALDESANGVISMNNKISEKCAPFASFPIGVDAGVVAYALTDAPTLNLTPQNIQDIFSGKVSNWADPSLKAANPDATLPSLPIRVVGGPDQLAVDSLKAWFKKLGVTFAPSLTKISPQDDGTALTTMVEGDIAITSYSNALYNFSVVSGVVVDAAANALPAVADASGIQHGADATYKPAEGDAPGYGAIYPINIALCGEDSVLARTIARYMLRQDAQGSLSSAVIAPLPDSLRVSTIALVEKGLPKATK